MEIGRCPEIPPSSVNTIITAAVDDDEDAGKIIVLQKDHITIIIITTMIHLCRAGFVEDSRDPGKRMDRWIHIYVAANLESQLV